MILHFKDYCNLIGWQHSGPKFRQICWWNINTNISFWFRLFKKKTNIKFFKKSKKTYFVAILGPFCSYLGKNELSWRKRLYQFFNIRIIYHFAKKKPLTSHSWECCVSVHQKSVYSIQVFVRYSQFQSSWDTANFRALHWLKNPTIWLAKSILDHISGIIIFTNMKFLFKHTAITVI